MFVLSGLKVRPLALLAAGGLLALRLDRITGVPNRRYGGLCCLRGGLFLLLSFHSGLDCLLISSNKGGPAHTQQSEQPFSESQR